MNSLRPLQLYCLTFAAERCCLSALRCQKYGSKIPSGKNETEIYFNICVSPSRRRCVEIIAKEGKSLKELYLVSCKITDHGRILSTTVPLLQSTSDTIIVTVITHSQHQDSGLIWFLQLSPCETCKQ